jgi:hypothetical protein
VQTALEQRMMTSERDREGVSTGREIDTEARTLRRSTTGLTNQDAQKISQMKELPALGEGNDVSWQCTVSV